MMFKLFKFKKPSKKTLDQYVKIIMNLGILTSNRDKKIKEVLEEVYNKGVKEGRQECITLIEKLDEGI